MATFDERFPYMAPSQEAMDAWRNSTPLPDFTGTNPGQSTGGFQVGDFGRTPDYFASLPSNISQGNPNKVQGASSGSGAGSAPISSTPSFNLSPSNAQATAQPSVAAGVVSGSIADYFYRTVIVILGFIFVAIGLNMFRPGIVPNPITLVKRK